MNDQVKEAVSQSRRFELDRGPDLERASLQDQRDILRLKKALKRALPRNVAPATLIRSIRVGIRA
ncbi:MAG TPA: hypothetical protein VGJ02_00080 [Pyrinomonadaceae bacterium]|jgi:hypothetical protein